MVGVALIAVGLIGLVGVAAVDVLGAGKWSGLGPAQQQAMLACVVTSLIGLSLIPLGDRPA
jgi:hypothetical protein